jgi:hypothetical protein
MIPFATDPGTHGGQQQQEQHSESPLLDDGFSAPQAGARRSAHLDDLPAPAESLEEALAAKSDF